MKSLLLVFVLMILPCLSVLAQETLSKELVRISIPYVDCEGRKQMGEIICNKEIEQDLKEIFQELFENRYTIERISLISEYGNDDERSMSANNTSCYCYRTINGQKTLSKHARGMAVDVNPLYNPCVNLRTGKIEPASGKKYAHDRQNLKKSGKLKVKVIDHDDLCYRLFKAHGFRWGGDWKTKKDYQHFEK